MTQTAHRFGRMQYLLHVPASAPDDTRRKHPLILFLHGAGERGDDPHRIKGYGLPRVIEDQPDFQFIVVSPQCPADHWWPYDEELLLRLLDHIIEHQFADTRRIYLTGASMGGYGAWLLGAHYPQRFAAVVPVCGVALSPPEEVCGLKDTAVWAFHGKDDRTVPAEQTTLMINALTACGGHPQAAFIDGAGHELGTTAYESPELYRWLIGHTLEK